MDPIDFIAWMRRQGLSPRTATAYARVVLKAERQAADLGTDLGRIDLPELDELVALWPRSHASRSQLKAALVR